MNGFTLKVIFALLSTSFLTSPTFAASATFDSSTQLGCMSCHQGETFKSDEDSKNKSNDLSSEHQSVPAD